MCIGFLEYVSFALRLQYALCSLPIRKGRDAMGDCQVLPLRGGCLSCGRSARPMVDVLRRAQEAALKLLWESSRLDCSGFSSQ